LGKNLKDEKLRKGITEVKKLGWYKLKKKGKEISVKRAAQALNLSERIVLNTQTNADQPAE
jgi:hypothetical protein